MLDVIEINEIAELRSYHLAWSALHAETPGASFPQTLEGVDSWWRGAPLSSRLRVLIVRADKRPIGILPLVEQAEAGPLGPVRVLTYPPGVSGPVGAGQAAILAVALRSLSAEPVTWDVFAVRQLAHDSVDRGRTALAMRLAGLRPQVEADDATSVVDFAAAGSWPRYLASLPVEMLRRLGERASDYRFVRHRPEPKSHGGGETRWDLYDACRAVAEQDSHNGSAPTFADLPEDRHEAACRLGMADVSVLMEGDRPVAYRYAFQHRGEVTTYSSGAIPTNPGAHTVLLGRVLEESFSRGDSLLRLGPGDEAACGDLRTGVEALSSLSHVAPKAWRPRVLRAARRLAGRFSSTG